MMLARAALVLVLAITASPLAWAQDGDWPGWRGDGSGVSRETGLPTTWSEDDGVAWKTRIRGLGNSSPVVFGDKVLLTTAMERRATGVFKTGLRWGSIALAAMAGLAVLAGMAIARRLEPDAAPGPAWYDALAKLEAVAAVLLAGWFFWKLVELLWFRQAQLTPQDPDTVWILTGEVAGIGLIALVGSLAAGTPRFVGALGLAAAAVGFWALQPPAEATMPVPAARQMGVLVPLAVAAGWFSVSWALGRFAGYEGGAAASRSARTVRQVGVAVAVVAVFGFFNFVEPRLGLRRAVIAVDRDSGDILWTRGVFAPSGRKWKTNTYATPTVATDGEHVVADFGPLLVVMDLDGRVLWSREEPLYLPYLRYGAARSPLIWEDRLIYAYYPENPDTSAGRITGELSYIVALEMETGREIWRTESIPGGHSSYATPIIVPTEHSALLAILVEDHLHTYDVRTGAHHGAFTMALANPVPGPVSDGGTIYVAGGIYGPQGAAAVELAAPAAGSGPRELRARWTTNRQTPDIASPLNYEGLLYWVAQNGRMFCHDAATGEVLWRQRLDGVFTGSPVAGEGKIYVPASDGTTYVLRAGQTFELLAQNSLRLARHTNASPAIAGGRIYIRGGDWLYSIVGTPDGAGRSKTLTDSR